MILTAEASDLTFHVLPHAVSCLLLILLCTQAYPAGDSNACSILLLLLHFLENSLKGMEPKTCEVSMMKQCLFSMIAEMSNSLGRQQGKKSKIQTPVGKAGLITGTLGESMDQ